MEKITLKAIERQTTGKGASKRGRKEGLIPGVVYRGGKKATILNVEKKALWQAVHTEAGENVIIGLEIGGKEKTVRLKELQHDPLKDDIIHVDFQEISLKEKLKVNVPITIKGEAVGVTEEGGVLNQVEWELEVECLPTEIPEHINIHVEGLHLNEAIHIKDIASDGAYKILGDPEQVVLNVIMPAAEEVEEGEEEEAAGVEPELIKKGKKEEEAAEGESEGE